MLKINFYGLRSAEDENDAPVDTLFGSVTFDDEGELKADPAAAEHQTLFDNVLRDPIRLKGKSINPAEDPERWILNAYKFYTGYMLRATKPVQSRRSMVDHPVDLLWRELLGVAPYPPGVEPVSERIRGTAFFPGGRGLWMPDPMMDPPDMPIGKVMVVGQDFHSRRNYKESLRLGCSIRNATWRNLLPLLEAAGICPNDCFFTNAYMGVRSDERSTGRFPGSRDDAFTKRCGRFFLVQLKVLRPRLLIALGKHVPQFLASVTPDLVPWGKCKTMTQIDAAGALQQNITFPSLAGVIATVAVITHPSILGANLEHRRYKALAGHAAEVALLSDAYRIWYRKLRDLTIALRRGRWAAPLTQAVRPFKGTL